MEKHIKDFAAEEKAAIKAAAEENDFSAKSLLEEIIPLINSYFIAHAILDGNKVKVSFLNGQTFRISAKEIYN